MREQKPRRGEDEFTTGDRDSEGPGEESERPDADNRLGEEKEMPQPSRTTYMKNSEQIHCIKHLSQKEEGVCVEFCLRLLSLLRSYPAQETCLTGDDKVGGFGANVDSGTI